MRDRRRPDSVGRTSKRGILMFNEFVTGVTKVLTLTDAWRTMTVSGTPR